MVKVGGREKSGMKNNRIIGLLALAGTVFFFSILVIVAKVYVTDISPMMLLFLRILVASIAFLPIFVNSGVWKKKKFKTLVFISLLSTVNVAFFMWGIQYTTASASQLIYAAQPMLNLLVSNYIIKDRRYPVYSYIGVIVGLMGLGLILYQSSVGHGETISGNIFGNLLIVVAMLGWFWYIMLSKKLSKDFSPLELSSTAVYVSLAVTSLLLLFQIRFTRTPIHLSLAGVIGAVYMGLFGTFLTYILMQIAIKRLSTLTVNLTSYVQPLCVAVLAIIFLGEKLTLVFVAGSILVFLGVFLTATLEMYNRRK